MLQLSGIFLLAALCCVALVALFLLRSGENFLVALESSVLAVFLLCMAGLFVSLTIITISLYIVGPIGTAIGCFLLMALALYLIGRSSD